MTRQGASRMVGRFGLLTVAPVLAFAFVSSIGGGAQAATNPPHLALSELAPTSVLHGNHATFDLQASDPGASALSGLAIRALLPAGVDYRAGSTSPATAGEPAISHDASGRTALVWSDLADLASGGSVPLSFQVDPEVAPSVNAIPAGRSFTIDSSAYASTDAATKPSFDALTGKAKDGVVTASATGSTLISALSVSVSSPSADGRMLRGAHDHQGLFTVTVANNGVAPTTNVVLDGYLSAALEFVGCGTVDNGHVEYQYAQTLVGHAGTPAGCRPSLGETAALTTDALGAALPSSAAWTHVQWSVGDLAPGDTQTVGFLAAVPLKTNVPFAAGAPSPQSLRQLANLDNNTGPPTDQAGAQTVLFEARGADPTGTVVGAKGSTSVTPVDLTVTKSVDHSVFAAGQQVVETITLHTSEYVDSRQITVDDLLPSGVGPGLTAPTPQYATPPLENADGTSTLSFVLDHVAPNGTATISVPLRDLARYRANSADTTLVAAGDSFADALTATSTGTTLRCASPDGLCARGAVQGIDGSAIATTIGIAAGDSSTLQSAPQAVVTSSVSERPAPGAVLNCATATYVQVSSSAFVRNDLACLRVHVALPAGVPARDAVLTAAIPSGLVASTADIASGPSAAPASALTRRAAGDLAWALGVVDPQEAGSTLYAAPGSTFDATIPVRVASDPTAATADDALLATFRLATNARGGSAALERSAVTLGVTEPRLSVRAGIVSDNAGAHHTLLPGAPQVAGALPGDAVTVAVAATNAGGVAATATEVWAQLPDGVSCAAISAISDHGRCGNGVVAWDTANGAALAVASQATRTVRFTMTVPAALRALKAISVTAAVRSYRVPTDAGGTNSYAPAANIDPAMSTSQAIAAQSNMSSATVVTADPTLTASVSATSPSPYVQGGSSESFTANVNASTTNNAVTQTGATDRIVIVPTVGAGLSLGTLVSSGPWTCYAADPANKVSTSPHCSNDSHEASATSSTDTSTAVITRLSVSTGAGTDTTLSIPVTVPYGATTSSTVGFTLSSTDAQVSPNPPDTIAGSPASHAVTITQPHLTLALGHTPTNPALGAPVTVQATLGNSTASPTDPATDIVVVDDLPADYTYDAGFTPVTMPAATGGETFGCTTKTVAGHTQVKCTLHAYSIVSGSPVIAKFGAMLPVAPATFSAETNTAGVSGGSSSTSPSGVTDSIQPAAPSLQLDQTVSPTPFRKGAPSVFTITVANTGTAASAPTTLTTTLGDLAAGTSFTPAVSSAPVTVTCHPSASSTATCDIASLPAASGTVTITVTPTTALTPATPPAASDIKNTISLADAAPTTPPDPVTTTHGVTTVPVAAVNLSVAVTHTPTPFGFGGGGTVSVTVTNVASSPDPYTGDVHLAIDLNHTTTGLSRTAFTPPAPWSCGAGVSAFTCDAPAASVSVAGGAAFPRIDIPVDIATAPSNPVMMEAVVTAPNDYDLGAGPTTADDSVATRGANITGVVYEDVNGNGTFNSGTDKGLAGLTVHLTGAPDVTTCDGTTVTATCPSGKPAGFFMIGANALLPATPFTLSVDLCTAGGGHGACASADYATGAAGGTPTPANTTAVAPPSVRTVAGLSILKADAGTDITGYNLGQVRSARVTVNVFKDDVDNKGLHPGFGGANPSDSGTVDLAGSQVDISLVSTPLFSTVTYTPNPTLLTSQTGGSGTVTFSFDSTVGTSFVYPGTYLVTVHQNGTLLLGHFSYLDADGTTVHKLLPSSRSATTQVIPTLPVADDSTANPQFGELTPAKLEGLSFRDKNDTGLYDSGMDTTVAAKVMLTGVDDLSASIGGPPAVDNASLATFSFGTLRPGTYVLTATVPGAGCPAATACLVGRSNDVAGAGTLGGNDNLTTPGDNPPDFVSNIPVKAADDGKNYNFTFIDPQSMSGYVYEDANDDGCFSVVTLCASLGGANDKPVQNVTVHVQGTDDRNQVVDDTAVTDATGKYTITAVRPNHFFATASTYTMTLSTIPAGFIDGTDSPGTAADETLTPFTTGATATPSVANTISNLSLGPRTGVTAINFDFALLQPNTVKGFVYNDGNDSGCFSADSGGSAALPGSIAACVTTNGTPLSGVHVILQGTDDHGNAVSVQHVTSSGTGAYEFDGLRPGSYRVIQVPLSGFLPGTNGVGKAGITSALASALDLFGSADSGAAAILNSDNTTPGVNRPDDFPSSTLGAPENAISSLCLYVTNTIANTCVVPTTTNTPSPGCAQQCEGETAAHNDLAEILVAKTVATVWLDPCENDSSAAAAVILNEFNGDPTACFPQVPGTRLSAIHVLLTGTQDNGKQFPFCDPLAPPPCQTGVHATTDINGNVVFDNLYPGKYTLSIDQPDGFRDGPTYPPTTSTGNVLNGVEADPAPPPVPAGSFPEAIFKTIVLKPDSSPAAGQSVPTGLLIGRRPPTASLVPSVSHTGDFTAGQQGIYRIVVDNNGPSPAQGPIVIIDTLPAGMTFNTFTDANHEWSCTPLAADVLCTRASQLAKLDHTDELDITVDVSADQPAGAVNNVVTATSHTLDILGFNRNSDSTNVVLSSDLAMHADISGLFGQNGVAVYVMTVTNNGPSAAPAQASVTDNFPRELTPVQFAGDWQCYGVGQAVTCYSNNPIEPGTSRALALFALVGVSNGSTVKDFVSVQGITNDPNLANNSDGIGAVVGVTVGQATINGPLPQVPTSGVPEIGGPNTGAGQRRWTQALLLVGLGSVLIVAAALVPGRRRRPRKKGA